MATRVLLALVVLSLSGCSRGWLYTNVVEPYCVDMDNTPITKRSSNSGAKQISIPRVPGARAVWSSNAIADAARKEGITHLEYCDRKIFSVIGGLWAKDSLIVYGN